MTSTTLPKTMRAIKINGTTASIQSVPLPTPKPTYLLAKIHSIALNPTDWKHITYSLAGPNGASGCDFAGTVVGLPTSATKSFKIGDRIAGVVHGANFNNAEDGCFAEYALAKADLVVKIPDELAFEKAATFPLGVSTVAQGLFQKGLKLEFPGDGKGGNGKEVLIYGGSTATGSLGIQFAKLAGYKVLTTCGAKNKGFVEGLGADVVYDYKEEGIGAKIRKETDDGLKLVWDCVGTNQAMEICAEALSSRDEGCRYATVTPQTTELLGRPGVTSVATLMYTIFDEAFEKRGNQSARSTEDFEYAKKIFDLTEKLVREGKLKTHPEEVGSKGLEGALQGMQDLKNEKVSGRKLVYRVEETPEGSKAEVQFA